MQDKYYTFESSVPPTDGRYAGMSSSTWFDYDEFMDFAKDYNQLNEISVASRKKIAKAAKRTAKIRARKRKLKEKRRKSKSQLKKVAQKAAINKIRAKLIKGMKWQNVPFIQREKIDAKIKKKKKTIAKLARKMMPSVQKAEKERLKRVKAKMTSNDPKKAIENLNIDFCNTFLFEDKELRARIQANDDRNKRNAESQSEPQQQEPKSAKKTKCPRCEPNSPVEVKRGKQTEIILFKQVKDDIHTLVSSSPVTESSAIKISKKDGFVCGVTAQSLGINCEEIEKSIKGDADGDGDVDKQDAEITDSGAQSTVATNKLNTARANTELEDLEKANDEKRKQEEIAMAQVEKMSYANEMGSKIQFQLPTKQNNFREDIPLTPTKLKPGTKEISKNSMFADALHGSVDVEVGVVAASNECWSHESGEEIVHCMRQAGMSDNDINKILSSPTLLPAGRRFMDRIKHQLPEGMVAHHGGRGFEGIETSQTWADNGAVDNTPKTDVMWKDDDTGESIRASMKIGDGQLMSGGAGESMATLSVIEQRMSESDGFSQSDKEFLKDISNLKKMIQDGYSKGMLGAGMGPTKWWLKDKNGEPNKIAGAKPKWWDISGPGQPCEGNKKPGNGCGVPWKDAVGKVPNKKWFKNWDAETDKKLLAAQKANKAIEEKFATMIEKNELFKRHAIFESLTGCGKFCECGGSISCCINECDSPAMATHFLTANKDGTDGSLTPIGGVNSKLITIMLPLVSLNVSMKSNTRKAIYSDIIDPKTGKPFTKATKQGQIKYDTSTRLQQKKMTDALAKAYKEQGPTIGDIQNESVQTFLEYAGDGRNKLQKSLEQVGNDPFKLMKFMEMDVDISLTHEDFASAFNQQDESEISGRNEVEIGGKKHFIPIMKKEDEYRDYQKEYEEDIQNFDESFNINESFRLLTEPDIVDRLVQQLKDKGMDNDKAHAIANSSLQKHGVLKKGTQELTAKGKKRNLMTASERAKSRASKKDGSTPSNYKYNSKTNIATQIESYDGASSNGTSNIGSNERKLLSKGVKYASGGKANVNPKNVHKFSSEIHAEGMNVINNQNLSGKDKKSQKVLEKHFKNNIRYQQHLNSLNESFEQFNSKKDFSYEFKDSSIHGIGSFATKDIQEGSCVSLFLLNILNEESPKFQRTDFCRLTNHSQHIPNLIIMEKENGNFFAYASKDIQEGEEFIINYFNVAEQIFPILGENGQIIEEVLKWTPGYEDFEFSEEIFDDFISELIRLDSLNESTTTATRKRAEYLKKYNAQPEQRKRRSARTNQRNKMIRSGKVSVGDGKDIDHKDGNPLNNSPKNISITSVSYNRGRNNN